MPFSQIGRYRLYASDTRDFGVVSDVRQGTPHPDTGVIQNKTVFRGTFEQCREWISREINHDRLSYAAHQILDNIIAAYLLDDHTGDKKSINDSIRQLLEWSNQFSNKEHTQPCPQSNGAKIKPVSFFSAITTFMNSLMSSSRAK